MFTLTVSGFVTGEVKREESEYGKRGILTVRAKTASGKQSHYVNATFYGKRIDTVEKFMEDGRLVSISGVVKNMTPKKKKDGTDYIAIYMDGCDFSLPERQSAESGYASKEDDVPF